MGNCSGNCAACSGCARELVLSQPEIDLLRMLGQYAYLPVARQLGDLTPVYPETDGPEDMSLVLQVLETTGLTMTDRLRAFTAKPMRRIPSGAVWR